MLFFCQLFIHFELHLKSVYGFRRKGWFHQYTLKSVFLLSNFSPNLPLYLKRIKIIIISKIQSIFFVQIFTSFLMDSIIFALGLFWRLKKADKVDLLEIRCFWSQISYWSTLLAFLSYKRCPAAQRNKSNRKLMKFWTRKMLHIYLFINFWTSWNKEEDLGKILREKMHYYETNSFPQNPLSLFKWNLKWIS